MSLNIEKTINKINENFECLVHVIYKIIIPRLEEIELSINNIEELEPIKDLLKKHECSKRYLEKTEKAELKSSMIKS